mmetsp:Transcript_21468/g.26339  ORF Transcript_21468/g.26339 Transcript_21468/m.26339 type:complete len:270 (-) Transcript_21468:33-842(-)
MSNQTDNEVSNNKHNVQSSGSNLAFGVIGTSFIGTILLISPFVVMQLRSPLPYMATPRKKVIVALEEISKRKKQASYNNSSSGRSSNSTNNNTKSPSPSTKIKKLKYYDLGSGDGETVLAAASSGWKSTGIELNSTLWGLSSIRRLFSSKHIRQDSNFIWGDMWSQSIYDADAVMIFGVKPLMPMIAKKVSNECRPGTYILSYRFLIPCITTNRDQNGSTLNKSSSNSFERKKNNVDGCDVDADVDDGKKLNADLIYNKEDMRIYELKS